MKNKKVKIIKVSNILNSKRRRSKKEIKTRKKEQTKGKLKNRENNSRKRMRIKNGGLILYPIKKELLHKIMIWKLRDTQNLMTVIVIKIYQNSCRLKEMLELKRKEFKNIPKPKVI